MLRFYFWKFMHNAVAHHCAAYPYEPRWAHKFHNWTFDRWAAEARRLGLPLEDEEMREREFPVAGVPATYVPTQDHFWTDRQGVTRALASKGVPVNRAEAERLGIIAAEAAPAPQPGPAPDANKRGGPSEHKGPRNVGRSNKRG